MIDLSGITTQQDAFDFLDQYAVDRRMASKKLQSSKEEGMIKSYMLETDQHGDIDMQKLFSKRNWRLKELNENFFNVKIHNRDYGFLERVSSRHIALHMIQRSDRTDIEVKKMIQSSAQLDSVWLSGHYLNSIWNEVIKPQRPNRYIKFKFAYEDIFREEVDRSELSDDEDLIEEMSFDTEKTEHRESTLNIGMTAKKIAGVLPQLQLTLPDFKVMRMLRLPAGEKIPGGYDFWDWGKVSYHSPSFRDGRQNLNSIIEVYQKITEQIEQRTWFQAEKNQINDLESTITLTGTPITFSFPIPLENSTFQNFIRIVFENGQSNFRLWGNPIRLGENKVHVYGLDMHLWQKIYMEITPSRFIVILPQNTCGNTVHRLVTNIQSYLSPDVQVFIGDTRYQDLVKSALFGEI
ncbi:MAG: hypothetical protein H0X30_24680 [Anaerolineae bacterium]|nr:hypothetical protein [Anaerolineae bacterium]